MTSNITQFADKQPEATATARLFEDWFDPIEAAVRAQVHEFIQGMIAGESHDLFCGDHIEQKVIVPTSGVTFLAHALLAFR